MISLLIDGYNLLHAIEKGFINSLQEKRDSLIQKLHIYQAQKSVEILVVFDGSNKNAGISSHDRYGNIDIVYADSHSSADDWIARACERSPGKFVVVSSDHQVMNSAKLFNCVALSSEDFLKRLNSTTKVIENPYLEDKTDDEDTDLYPRVSTKKKGAAKRLPKKERKKIHHLKNL